MVIEENKILELNDVLSYRGKMTQQEIALKMQEIDKLLSLNETKPSGPVVTTTFSIEQNGILDFEILVPINKCINIPEGFVYKEKFLLTNALMIKHIGNPSTIDKSIQELNRYIEEKGLVTITTGYNVTVKKANSPLELDDMEVDIYVGISPNIL